MFKFFEMIGDFISTIVDAVIFAINQVLNVVELIGKGAAAVFGVMAVIPVSLRILASAFVAYCIIINILSRGA